LCTFLEAFRNENVNLSRIISRPIRGCPGEYAFLVDIEGATGLAKVKAALRSARKTSVQLRVVGSYPVRREYRS
jgi:chorismate mutase/prephenate dehydratase